MPRSVRRTSARVAAALVVALAGTALSGCVPSPSVDPGTPGLTAAQFEAAGITIIDDDTGGTAFPVADGLMLTELQVERLLTDAALGGGIQGRELDALAPVPADTLPPSYLLAAWLVDGTLPGAQAAITQFDDPDWASAPDELFPPAVVALFVGDMATLAAQEPQADGPAASSDVAGAALTIAPAALVADGPCTFVTGLLNAAITGLFDVLRVLPTAIGVLDVLGPLGGWLSTAITIGIELAQKAVEGLLSSVLAPVFSFMRLAIGALGVATVVLSYFQNQKLTLTPKPGSHHVFSVDPAARNTGSFTARASNLSKDQWPPALVDCAQAVGAPLPELIRAGDTAKWAMVSGADLITLSAATSTVANDRTASIDFETGHEDAETAKGDEVTKASRVTAEIPRKEIGDFLDLAAQQVEKVRADILALVPGILRSAAESVLAATMDPTIASIRSTLAGVAGGILSLKGEGYVDVTFHTPKEPDPTSTPVPDEPGDDDGEFCRQFAVQADAAAASLPGASDPFSWAAAFASGLNTIDAEPPAEIAGDFDIVVAFYGLAGQSSFENAQALADYTAANDVDGARARLWGFCGVPPINVQ